MVTIKEEKNMLKKLFVGVLCIGVLAMFGAQEAKAWPRIAGWGLSGGSVFCESFWKAIGNSDVNYAYVECELNIEEVQTQCVNNGGGTGGLGNPFEVYGEIIGDQLITPKDLVGNGKAFSEIYFSDKDIYDALFCDTYVSDVCTNYVFPSDICQNPNWSVVSPDSDGTIVVTRTGVILSGYAYSRKDIDKENPILTDQVELMCTITDEIDEETGNRLYYCE
jgi:hypothetical protein